MRERPIPFCLEMVVAFLNRRKSQTRRIIKPQPPEGYRRGAFVVCSTDRSLEGKLLFDDPSDSSNQVAVAPPYRVGDRLWVRETWRLCDREGRERGALDHVRYRADGAIVPCDSIPDDFDRDKATSRWRPGMFMPRWASRIDLQATYVRAEKLLDITEKDAEAEGVVPMFTASAQDFLHGSKSKFRTTYRTGFLHAFDALNRKRMPSGNPWLWAIHFQTQKIRCATNRAELDWESNW